MDTDSFNNGIHSTKNNCDGHRNDDKYKTMIMIYSGDNVNNNISDPVGVNLFVYFPFRWYNDKSVSCLTDRYH